MLGLLKVWSEQNITILPVILQQYIDLFPERSKYFCARISQGCKEAQHENILHFIYYSIVEDSY